MVFFQHVVATCIFCPNEITGKTIYGIKEIQKRNVPENKYYSEKGKVNNANRSNEINACEE
jgi:hypothetical protein